MAVRLLKLLGGLVFLLLIALVVAGFFIDGIARTAIQEGGSRALGVPTTLDDVDIGVLGGTASLSGLRIASPEPYGTAPFLELDRGSIEVSAGSLFGDTVEVPELGLSGIRVNLVQALRGSNYGTILDNLLRFQGSGGSTSEGGKRFVVRKLVIEDVIVTAVPAKELDLAPVTIPIDRIELQDVGSDSDGGVLLSELSGIVVEAILKRASATGRLPSLVQGVLGGKLDGLRGLQDAGVKALQDLTGTQGAPGDLRKRVDETTKDVRKRFEGLIGK